MTMHILFNTLLNCLQRIFPSTEPFISVVLTRKKAPKGCKKLSYLYSLLLCTQQVLPFNDIGPPDSCSLTSTEKGTWMAKDVDDSVLSDKSELAYLYCILASGGYINFNGHEGDGDSDGDGSALAFNTEAVELWDAIMIDRDN